MRISDWSSDVCSSDLRAFLRVAAACRQQAKRAPDRGVRQGGSMARSPLETAREDVNTCPEVADEIKQTTCYMCACRCGINVYLKDGKIRYLEGNPDHPVNQGVLCAKGSADRTSTRLNSSHSCAARMPSSA